MKKPRELETYLLSINSSATRKAYQIDINQFLDFMGDTFDYVNCIKEVKENHVESFTKILKNEKLAPNTINRKIAANINFFEFLILSNVISTNVWSVIERVDEVIKNPTAKISPDEIQSLLEAVDNNEEVSLLHQAILFTLFSTGIKQGELINLRIEDFIEEHDSSFLMIKFKGDKLKTRIKLSSKCASKIERYLDQMMLDSLDLAPSDCLFRPTKNPSDMSNLNKPMNPKSVHYIVKTWCNRTGLGTKISSHSARQFFIEEEIEKKPSLKIIRRKFGISVKSYDLYKKIKSEEMRTD